MNTLQDPDQADAILMANVTDQVVTSVSAIDQESEVEGSFKADEVDVIYVTAPNGYKFRFKFMFEWEIIEIPSNGTVYMINGTTYNSDGLIYTPQFDEFGIPTDYTATCTVGDFDAPSAHIFQVSTSFSHLEYCMKILFVSCALFFCTSIFC